MDIIWSRAAAMSVNETHSVLEATRQVAYTTVKTTMERLANKGILRQQRDGKAYLYEAALSQAALERRIVAQVLDGLLKQFPRAVASFFVQPAMDLTGTHLALLALAIETAEENNADEGSK